MKVVNLSLDPKSLDTESVVAFRYRAYGELVERFTVVVPTPASVTVTLSDSVIVYGVGGIHKPVRFIRMYRRIVKLVQGGQCDVITTQDPYFLGLLGYYFAWRYHLGFEVQVLGIEKLTPLRKLLAAFILKRASVVRALSDRLKRRLVTEFGVSENTIHVVTIYVDVHKLGLDVRTLSDVDMHAFEKLSREFKDTYGHCVNFLTVSRLVPIKNIPVQLTAMEHTVKEFPDTRLHIVGDGPEEDTLKKDAHNRGLKDHVIFHGYKTGYELGLFYIECDCFVLASDYEGWSMVTIEAATAGLPIIMTDVGCAGELVVDGESGLVIPVRDTGALTGAMRRIITEQKLRNDLSVGAMHAIRALPTFDEVLKRYKENWQYALEHTL